ncbi:hypothetical protein G6011_04769 [Alternaria panax]|uniref:Uncharacterized protein n=1 Tax=Alternaria panax TaxID=48097 RepID=A0AAD4II38_9PLEO|nr:hypothetical protein G6011_04769 [Alternaria panax]
MASNVNAIDMEASNGPNAPPQPTTFAYPRPAALLDTDHVILDVYGRKYLTRNSVLKNCDYSGSLLGGQWSVNQLPDGSLPLDADPKVWPTLFAVQHDNHPGVYKVPDDDGALWVHTTRPDPNESEGIERVLSLESRITLKDSYRCQNGDESHLDIEQRILVGCPLQQTFEGEYYGTYEDVSTSIVCVFEHTEYRPERYMHDYVEIKGEARA